MVKKAVHQETVTPEPAPNCSATPKSSLRQQQEGVGAIFWITTLHGRGKHGEAEGKDCSHATGLIKQAKTWMAQMLYHVGAPRSPERQLCKRLVLRGHLDRERKVALQHRQLGEMQRGRDAFSLQTG